MERFSDIEIGKLFDACGNVWVKRSTRTAAIVKSRRITPDGQDCVLHTDHAGTIGYFRPGEVVGLERKWWQKRGALKTQIRVILRVTRDASREVIAFFPDTRTKNGMIECYAHVDQHSDASMEYYRYSTRRCLIRAEADKLLAELRGIYNDEETEIVEVMRMEPIRPAKPA